LGGFAQKAVFGGEFQMGVISTASSSFVVVENKICEKCGRSFLRSAGSPAIYCAECEAFFRDTAMLDAGGGDPEPRQSRKTGPKPGSARTAGGLRSMT
jgi:hypothetical protein